MRCPLLLALLLCPACGSESGSTSVPWIPSADAAVDLGALPESSPADSPPEVEAEAEAEACAPNPTTPPSGRRVGANVVCEGVEFRVWAPHASSAWVAGDFNGGKAIAMAAEATGYYATVVADATPGQHYHFVLENGQDSLRRLDPRSRWIVGGPSGDSVVVDPGAYLWQTAGFTPPAREQAVVYELHVGGFTGTADQPGTFATLRGKLDYLQALGVNVIELMPANFHGGEANWGYNPQAYFAPHPTYGEPEDLRFLVDQAHARGIAVVLDVVYNHYDNWDGAPLWCFDGTCPDNAGIYFFPSEPYDSTPWGPRLYFSEPQVYDYIVDSVYTWMTEYRIDGFRWDSTSNIRGIDGAGTVPGGKELLQWANDMTHATVPGALSIAEDLKGWGDLTKGTSEDGFGFDAQWDGFGWTIRDTVIPAEDSSRDMNAVRDAIEGSYNGDPFQRLIFTDNHDVDGNGSSRLASLIDSADPGSWAARKRTTLAAAVLLTTPGVPMLFMGQEFLERGSFTDPPAELDWSKHDSYGPIEDLYRDLIRLRRNMDGVSTALMGPNVDAYHVNNDAKVIAYRRWDVPEDQMIVVANFGFQDYGEYDVGLPSGGTWIVRLNSDELKYSTDFGGSSSADVNAQNEPRDGLPAKGAIVLGRYAVVILSK